MLLNGLPRLLNGAEPLSRRILMTRMMTPDCVQLHDVKVSIQQIDYQCRHEGEDVNTHPGERQLEEGSMNKMH